MIQIFNPPFLCSQQKLQIHHPLLLIVIMGVRSPRDSALQYNGLVQQPDFLSILMNALQEFHKLNECQQMRCSITRQSKPGVYFVESKESDHTPWLLSGSNKPDLARFNAL